MSRPEVHLYYGQPGTGKTTAALEAYSSSDPLKSILLDGDSCRKLWPNLGYTPEDRHVQQIRMSDIAAHFYNKQMDVFVATICPTKQDRQLWESKFPPESFFKHYMGTVYDKEKNFIYKCEFFEPPVIELGPSARNTPLYDKLVSFLENKQIQGARQDTHDLHLGEQLYADLGSEIQLHLQRPYRPTPYKIMGFDVYCCPESYLCDLKLKEHKHE